MKQPKEPALDTLTTDELLLRQVKAIESIRGTLNFLLLLALVGVVFGLLALITAGNS